MAVYAALPDVCEGYFVAVVVVVDVVDLAVVDHCNYSSPPPLDCRFEPSRPMHCELTTSLVLVVVQDGEVYNDTDDVPNEGHPALVGDPDVVLVAPGEYNETNPPA